MRTLLSGGTVITVDADRTVLPSGDVVFEDDRLTYVGPCYTGEYDRRVAVNGKLVLPGLINAHTHSPMTLFRGLADDVDLQVFLNERVWPREVRLTGEEVYAGSVLAAVEMLHSGVTTYVDMYFWEGDLARAALDVGLRAVITPGILDVPSWEPLLGRWERRTQAAIEFCREWEGREGRMHTGLGPHAPYTLPLEAMGEVAEAAREAGVPVHTHLLEARWERDVYGGPIAALEARGFFDGPVLAAHCVWVDAADIEICRFRKVGIAHCPQSNAKLGAGVAPLPSLLAAGLSVGLGTDGAATNNNLDLWEELRLAPLLAKAQALDPTVVTARQALDMATCAGAAAIQRGDIGSLEPGKRADVLLLRGDDTVMTPIFDPQTYVGHIVYAAGRDLVDAVWVNGRQVMKDGEVLTIDEERARRAAQEAADAVSARLDQR